MGDLLKMNSARSVIRKQIVAATRGNGREAPRADLNATSSGDLSNHCCIKPRWARFAPMSELLDGTLRFAEAKQTSPSATGCISLSGHMLFARECRRIGTE